MGCETGGVWEDYSLSKSSFHYPPSPSAFPPVRDPCCQFLQLNSDFFSATRHAIESKLARNAALCTSRSFNVCICGVLQDEEELVLPLRPKKSPLNGLCCLTFGLVVFMAGLVLASIFVYRYYFIPHVRLDYALQCAICVPLLALQWNTALKNGGENVLLFKNNK